MRFDIITIFPDIFSDRDSLGYFGASIISRAQKKGIIKINVHNLRNFAQNKHKTVDDTPYGGGPGMVMKVEPIYKAVQSVKNSKNINKRSDSTVSTSKATRTILFSAKGKKYTQADARRLSKYGSLVLICGRYEGVDERVAKYIADEEISVGDYVLTGGEIPAMILVDSITRLIPGVLGNSDSLKEESFGNIKNLKFRVKNSVLEYPQYTKPEIFMEWKAPKVLLSGDHKKIEDWRGKNSKTKE